MQRHNRKQSEHLIVMERERFETALILLGQGALEGEDLLTARGAAEVLGTSKRNVLGLIEHGTLPARNFGGIYVLALEDVQKYAKSTRRRPDRAKTSRLTDRS